MNKEIVRLAAVADIHCTPKNRNDLHDLFIQMTDSADVLALCGDLTDTGLVDDAHILADLLAGTVKVPVVGVLGNHDFDAGHQGKIKAILRDAGVTVLDGEIHLTHGIGFAGVKGFCGGFDKHELQPWGEKAIKDYVQEAVNEELKLESALAKLDAGPRLVLMHYSPVRATIIGEHPEIFSFLGSSRLEAPIDEFGVTAVLHGHAHHGSPTGNTARNVPVYNVSLPMLRKLYPDKPPFGMLEIPTRPTG